MEMALATPRGVSAPATEPSSGEFDIVIKAAKRHRVHSDPFGDAIQKPAFKVSMRVKNVAASVIGSAEYVMHVKKGGKAIGFGMAAGDDETVSFGWPVKMSEPLPVSEGGTGATSAAFARFALGCVASSGDTMTGNLTIQGSLYPSLILKPTYNSTTNRIVFEGSYVGAASFSAWEDSTGNDRRMLEVRTAAYQASLDNEMRAQAAVHARRRYA